jgi:hypothetical protein
MQVVVPAQRARSNEINQSHPMSINSSLLRGVARWCAAAGCAALFTVSISAQKLAPPKPSAAAIARLQAGKKQSASRCLWSAARDQTLRRVLDPNQYECGLTPLDFWVFAKFDAIQNWDAFFEIVVYLDAWSWPTYYSLFLDHDASDDYIGRDGKQTAELKKRHKDAQRFWDVPTQDVLLQGMHGNYIADDAKMRAVLESVYGVPSADAAIIVDYVQWVIESDPGLGYSNPLWTLNAFASSSRGEPVGSPYYGTPDKIVMGDGIMEALADMGLGINAPDFVHAHEFGHHVQFERGLLDDYYNVPPDDLPEWTRHIEMMADAFGTYYCAHSRGAAFQSKRVVDAFTSAYAIGDCAFDFPGHHGTPNQRRRAAQWAADLADAAKKQGKINPSATMVELFDLAFPGFVAPEYP